MLTMRNGLSLHPGYSLGSLQSMLAPPSVGLDIDEGIPLLHTNRGLEFSRDQNDVFMQTPANHGPSALPMLVPSTSNAANSAVLPSYGLMASTKVLMLDFLIQPVP